METGTYETLNQVQGDKKVILTQILGGRIIRLATKGEPRHGWEDFYCSGVTKRLWEIPLILDRICK